LAGAGIVAATPFAARASGNIDALCVTCIDYRLVASNAPFFDNLKLHGEYDQVSLAGASLAAVSPKFPSANAAFWDQLAIAKNLHHVQRLIVLDHRDCGAFKVAFGKDFAASGAPETAQHKGVMAQVQQELAKRQPGLGSEFYLMALDGKAERVL
jgi:carbonic anhydrase